MISSQFPCIQGFFQAWSDFKTNFHFRPMDTHNNLLHSPIFFNPWILQSPSVKDFSNYGKIPKKTLLPEDFSISKEVRHRKLIDLLDHQGLKPLNELKDDPDFAEINWLSYFRLSNSIKAFAKRNHVSTIKATGVSLPKDKTGRTPLDYMESPDDAFKRISKGSGYFRRILLLHRPASTVTYRSKMEKRFGMHLRQGYVNKITGMLNDGTIPPGNADILHRLILGKTKAGIEIRTWKNSGWDGFCKMCKGEIETIPHIFTCKKTREFLDNLHIQLHVHRVGGTSTILGDHYLWMDFKQRDTVLTQFVVSTFYITDIMQSRLTGDPLSWRRTRFKLIAYLSNLLGSNNGRMMQLGESLRAMLRTC